MSTSAIATIAAANTINIMNNVDWTNAPDWLAPAILVTLGIGTVVAIIVTIGAIRS